MWFPPLIHSACGCQTPALASGTEALALLELIFKPRRPVRVLSSHVTREGQ